MNCAPALLIAVGIALASHDQPSGEFRAGLPATAASRRTPSIVEVPPLRGFSHSFSVLEITPRSILPGLRSFWLRSWTPEAR